MSRPIKFRAWPIYGEFQYYDLVAGEEIYIGSSAKVIEQFTGLTDKNGKEIYEGDLMKLTNPKRPNKKYHPHEVVYESGKARFSLKSVGDNSQKPGGLQKIINERKELWEIIGNIHENPELLEDK